MDGSPALPCREITGVLSPWRKTDGRLTWRKKTVFRTTPPSACIGSQALVISWKPTNTRGRGGAHRSGESVMWRRCIGVSFSGAAGYLYPFYLHPALLFWAHLRNWTPLFREIWHPAVGAKVNFLQRRFRIHILPFALLCLGAAAAGLYLLHLCAAVLAERALYSDGSHFFTSLLRRDFGWPFADDPKHIRLFVNYINQFPVAMAIKAGVEDLRTLKLLFGAALFFTPIIIYLGCYINCRRAKDYRILFFVAATVLTCTMPSEFFILNQAFTTLALCWLLLCYVLLDFRLRVLDHAVVVVVLWVLFRAHEGMVLWGVVLFCAAAARLIRARRRPVLKNDLHICLIGLTGLLHTLFVLYWQASHPVGEQTQVFLNYLMGAHPNRMWDASGATRLSLLTWVALVASLAGISLQGKFIGSPRLSKAVLVLCWGIAVVCATFALQVSVVLFDEPWRIRPWPEKSYRFLVNFGSVFWMGLAVVFWWARMQIGHAWRSLMQFILAVGLAGGSVWQLGNTKYWGEFQNQAALIVKESNKTFISSCEIEGEFSKVERSWLLHNADSWTWPAYSIAIQNSKRVSKVVISEERPKMFQIYEGEDYHVSASHVVFFPDGFFDFSDLIRAHRAAASAAGRHGRKNYGRPLC